MPRRKRINSKKAEETEKEKPVKECTPKSDDDGSSQTEIISDCHVQIEDNYISPVLQSLYHSKPIESSKRKQSEDALPLHQSPKRMATRSKVQQLKKNDKVDHSESLKTPENPALSIQPDRENSETHCFPNVKNLNCMPSTSAYYSERQPPRMMQNHFEETNNTSIQNWVHATSSTRANSIQTNKSTDSVHFPAQKSYKYVPSAFSESTHSGFPSWTHSSNIRNQIPAMFNTSTPTRMGLNSIEATPKAGKWERNNNTLSVLSSSTAPTPSGDNSVNFTQCSTMRQLLPIENQRINKELKNPSVLGYVGSHSSNSPKNYQTNINQKFYNSTSESSRSTSTRSPSPCCSRLPNKEAGKDVNNSEDEESNNSTSSADVVDRDFDRKNETVKNSIGNNTHFDEDAFFKVVQKGAEVFVEALDKAIERKFPTLMTDQNSTNSTILNEMYSGLRSTPTDTIEKRNFSNSTCGILERNREPGLTYVRYPSEFNDARSNAGTVIEDKLQENQQESRPNFASMCVLF